jgi:hypothetical protein
MVATNPVSQSLSRPAGNCGGCDPVAELMSGSRRPSFGYWHYSTPRTAFTALQSADLVVNVLPDSYFVAKKLVVTSTGSFTVQMYDGSTGKLLQAFPVNNVNVFGTIQLPNVLLDPIVLPPSSSIVFKVTDTSNAGNTIQISLVGYRHYDLSKPPMFGKLGKPFRWFQYVVNSTVAANGQTTPFIKVDADADFLVRKIISNQTSASLLAMISDASSGDQWFDLQQVQPNVFGTAQYPNILAKPRLIKANSSINLQLNDLSGSENIVQVIFEGAKIGR